MEVSEMTHKLSQIIERIIQIAKLPVVHLQFCLDLNPEDVETNFRNFTRPHPKYKIFQNKSIGAALLDLSQFKTRDEYLQTVKGHNSAGHHAKKARGKGYVVTEIDQNDYIEDIYEINTSIQVRQGRIMDDAYRKKQTSYRAAPNFKYFGVLSPNGKLRAYAELGFYGNFAAFRRIIGVRNNDGIMHLMVTEVVCQLIDARDCQYLMYDTYFGASEGLQTFKKMFGFQPCRAKYSIS